MSVELNGVHVWEAFNDPGEPICIADQTGQSTYSINLYQNDSGAITGIMIFDDVHPVVSIGFFPAEYVGDLLSRLDHETIDWADSEDYEAEEYECDCEMCA